VLQHPSVIRQISLHATFDHFQNQKAHYKGNPRFESVEAVKTKSTEIF